MARSTVHVCSECGLQSAQWHGQCPRCEQWNTLVEERIPAAQAKGAATRRGAAGEAPRQSPRRLMDVGAAPVTRMSSGIGELDRVLGGGLVPGSLTLLGG